MDSAQAAQPVDFDAMPLVGDIPRYYARRKPNAVVTWFDGRETDWATFDRHVNQVANALIAAGAKHGDHIAYLGKGNDEFFELMFACAKAGLILTPVIFRLATPEVAHIVDDADCKILIISPDQLERLADLCDALPKVQHIICTEQGGADAETFSTWRDAASDHEPGVDVKVDDVALQLYTSGTTGRPKGVMLSHRNLLHGRREGMAAKMDWNTWQEDDVNVVAMPLGHIGGCGWGLVGFYNGAKSIIEREFHPARILEAIEKRGASKMFLVPAALQMVLMQPNVRDIDYSRVRYILYGASPIALDLLREAKEVFGCGFCQQYGMTETTGTVVYLPPEDHTAEGNQRMRGAGKAMPGVELRIVDSNRNPLPPGETGEIETRSVANMVGYWKQGKATKDTVDGEGWLRTGDAGYLDEDGYLYIQDRIKDMIVSGGENVYPAEVESAIYGHPAIQEVAVIGVPDEKWGEAVKAIVVLKPGQNATADDIIAFARTRIAGFKVPKSVDFAPVLPRNPTGKVLRRMLREPYWAGRERQVN